MNEHNATEVVFRTGRTDAEALAEQDYRAAFTALERAKHRLQIQAEVVAQLCELGAQYQHVILAALRDQCIAAAAVFAARDAFMAASRRLP